MNTLKDEAPAPATPTRGWFRTFLSRVLPARRPAGKLRAPQPWPDPPDARDTLRDLRAQVHQLNAQLNRCEAEKEALKAGSAAYSPTEADTERSRDEIIDLIADQIIAKAFNPNVEDHLAMLKQTAGPVCPRDTNGDGDCGQPACPVCGPKHLRPV